MTLSEAKSLFAYDQWANARMFGTVEALSDDQLTRPLGTSFPTIRDAVAHIIVAEWAWLCRWQGDSPRAYPDWVTGPLPGLKERLQQIERDRARYLDALSEVDLERTLDFKSVDGTPYSLPLDHLFRHLVNHSTYHRGQVAAMLRQVGGAPISTDFVRFVVEGAATQDDRASPAGDPKS